MTTQTRPCARCEAPVPESLGTKPRRYCTDSCKQRAYEERKLARAVDEAATTATVQALAAWAPPARESSA